MHFSLTNVKLIENYHKTYHFYNISLLEKELTNIQSLTAFYQKSTNYPIIVDIINNARNKINLIKSHNPRAKRGLINGLGTAIGWLTGNMNADDKKHYDQVINEIERNNYNIEHNIESTVNFNKHLIDTFKKDMTLINNNFNKGQNNIIKINTETAFHDIYISLSHLYYKIDEITLTLELCKMGITHTSIMSQIIKDVHENVNLASKNPEILWLMSKIHCTTHKDILHIFVSLPKASSDIKAYLILPTPIKHEQSYVTMNVPKSVIIVKKDNSYNANCTYLIDNYYCINPIVFKNKCISNILYNGKLSHCNFIKYTNPNVTYIDELDVYLTIRTHKLDNCYNNNTIFLPDTALINVSNVDCYKEIPPIHNHIVAYKYHQLYDTSFKIQIDNVTTIPQFNVTQIELIPLITNEYNYIYSILSIIIIVIIVPILFYICHKYCKGCCSKTIPIDIPTVVYQAPLPKSNDIVAIDNYLASIKSYYPAQESRT